MALYLEDDDRPCLLVARVELSRGAQEYLVLAHEYVMLMRIINMAHNF